MSKPRLTIGMATFRDHFGLWPTLVELNKSRGALDLTREIELLVIDNEPHGPHGEANSKLAAKFQNARYVPFSKQVGTSAPRNEVFRAAHGDWVLCIDSHVMLCDEVLRKLYGFVSDGEIPQQDLYHGPLMDESGETCVWTHWEPRWGENGMFGKSRVDFNLLKPGSDPVSIPLAGLGLFLARKDAWLGFHPQQKNFGGEEGYIHQKYRAAGRQCWCLPWLRWIHRFRLDAAAEPLPYKTDWLSRCWNYLLSAKELGYPSLQSVRENHVNGSVATVENYRGEVQPLKIRGRVTHEEWQLMLKKLEISKNSC